MIKIEEITSDPTFSYQLENKMLYSDHSSDISVSYRSTYTLKYVIEGVKKYNYNGQDIEVSKNQYLILNNDCNITTEAKKGTKGLSLFLSPILINDIYQHRTNQYSSIDFIEIPQKNPNSQIHRLLDKIVYLYADNPIVFSQKIEELFIQISELIVQDQVNIDSKFKRLKVVKHDTKKGLFKLVSEAKEYINDNIQESLSLDSISKDVGISKYYLHRIFTEINGSTPLGYLTNIRIEKAKNKLQYSRKSIFEIAMSCGFDNTSYFSNSFKKHTGLSPSQFRKRT